MEMEYFVPPAEAPRWYEHWLEERIRWYQDLGIRPDHLRLRAHDQDELSHYSSATSDVEYLFPIGWSELRASPTGATSTSPNTPSTQEETGVRQLRDRRPSSAARDRARRHLTTRRSRS